MPFILGFFAVVGTIIFFIIRLNRAARAARDLAEMASEAKGFLRRRDWNSQTNTDQIRDIEDPRLAAAVMMCALASADADLSEREVNVILEQLTGPLDIDSNGATEMLAQARWLTRDMKDVNTVLHRAAPPVQANCTGQEKAELFDMLIAVSEADGPSDTIKEDALDHLHRELGLSRR